MGLDLKNAINIDVNMTSPNGMPTKAQILVIDGFGIFSFSYKGLAKKLYKMEKKDGKDVKFKNNTIIERYKGLDKKEIVKKICEEIKKSGGSYVKKIS